MEIRCPACRSKIALDDINPSTDAALCRRCGKAHSFALLNAVATTDLRVHPSGTRFEVTAGGFVAEATTRSWMAALALPLTCVWIGMFLMAMFGWHGHIENGMPLPVALLLCVVLLSYAAFMVAGKVRVRRDGDELEIVTRVGPIGWTRRRRWSEIRTVQEETTTAPWGQRSARCIVLDGVTRTAFGSTLSTERRYFMVNVLRKMVANV